MNRKDFINKIASLINDCTALICFTLLALYFGKWWLVFFVVLFWE